MKEEIEREPKTLSSVARSYALHPKRLFIAYRDHLSGFKREEMGEDLLYPEHVGARMSIDDTCLWKGEFYTVLGNKMTGKLAGLLKGTKAATISSKLYALPLAVRMQVREISLDMASSYDWVTRECFPNAIKVVDRFHVEKLVSEAVQSIRVQYRQEALKEAKPYDRQYENGDTKKELLARSRYLLFKKEEEWTPSQRMRATILFREYPDIEVAYHLAQSLKQIYNTTRLRTEAEKRIKTWYQLVKGQELEAFVGVLKTIKKHEGRILNYFPNKVTNAFAESLNAKLKQFRNICKGVNDKKFFLFRVSKYFSPLKK